MSVWEYFGDTLANVGLSEAWLELESNFMISVNNKYVSRESLSLTKLKLQ